MKKICKNCKWAYLFDDNTGECQNKKVLEGKVKDSNEAWICGSSQCGCYVEDKTLYVGPNFGCVHWEGNER